MSIFINGIDRTPVNSLVLLNAASGNEVANRMDYTVNKAAGNDTGYVINKIDTLSSGISLFFDGQVNGSSYANITDNGGAYFASNVGVGTTSPDRLLHAEYASALTNTVQQVARLTHITSGTPANSIGVGLEFEQETSASNNEIIATIETIVVDVTAANEDADILLKNMAGGAAATEKLRIRSTGVCGHSPVDNAASPVPPTNPLNTFFYNASKVDDAVITCPAITTSAYGVVILGTAEEYARFIIDNVGTVTLLDNSANVVANADTDTKLCIGTAATQEPLQIKNRLGGTKILNVMLWYD